MYYIYMINGFMYKGPDERPGEKADIMPLYADKPYDGYSNYRPGVEGRTRPYQCKPRSWLTGTADMCKFSIRGPTDAGMAPATAVGRVGRTVPLQLGYSETDARSLGRVSAETRRRRSQGLVT